LIVKVILAIFMRASAQPSKNPHGGKMGAGMETQTVAISLRERVVTSAIVPERRNWHRSHFGSRYKLGCCGHASLLLAGWRH